jgi:hypothetical protein
MGGGIEINIVAQHPERKTGAGLSECLNDPDSMCI